MCGMNLQKIALDLTIKFHLKACFHFVWIRDMMPDYLVHPNEPILKQSRCISLGSFVIGCLYLFWEQVFSLENFGFKNTNFSSYKIYWFMHIYFRIVDNIVNGPN